MDAAGRPATDPGALYAGGSLLPLGGREGHKGYCLALAVDVLGGLLPGAGAGGLNPRLGNGCLFLVLDPRAFGEEADFLDHIEEYAAYLKSSPCKAGVEEVLLPGEPEAAAEERRRREGIAVDDETWGKIAALARELGVRLPEG
jgi:uncharacterized oxidoreductase